MSTLSFSQNSILTAGGQTYSIAKLVTFEAGADLPAVLALRAYDRDKYPAAQTFDYGHFDSPAGGRMSAGAQYEATTLYFDLVDGAYVSRASGEPLAAYTFTSSGQNFRSVYLSLFTSDKPSAAFVETPATDKAATSIWMDSGWSHQSDLNVVTRTDFVDATPNTATPAEIAAVARSFVGQVWNSCGCWLLTSNISAAAGASLPVSSGILDLNAAGANTQWDVLFNASTHTGDWRALLQPGDVVLMGYLNGKAHIATVVSGSGHGAMWIDNFGQSAGTSNPDDIIIAPEHSVELAATVVDDKAVVIYRLAAPDTLPVGQPATVAVPVVTPHSQSIEAGHAISLAALVSVRDPNLLAMSSYQITDGSGKINLALNGAVNLATDAQKAQGVVIVSAADFGKLTYKAAPGAHDFTVTAFNGQAWGSANVSVTGWIDPPPVVTGSSTAVHAMEQATGFAGLFSVATSAGRAVTEYRIIDTDNSGLLRLLDRSANLATADEAAKGVFRLKAADLDDLVWLTRDVTGNFLISASDGVQWSDYAQVTLAGLNAAPVVAANPVVSVAKGSSVSLASLLSMTDADGDTITRVSFYDLSGNIELNGASDLCPLPNTYEVALADLAKVTYKVPDSGFFQLLISAKDSATWSLPTMVTISVENQTPFVKSVHNLVAPGQTVALAEVFTAVDPAGKTIQTYRVADPAGGGSIDLNGARNIASAAERAQGYLVFSAAELGKVVYHGAAGAAVESLRIEAFNGTAWGAGLVQMSTAIATAPRFTTSTERTFDLGATMTVLHYAHASSPSGQPLTQYKFHLASGGELLLNGATNLATAAQKAAGEVVVSAEQAGRVQFATPLVAGAFHVDVAAYDGLSWGATDLVVTTRDFKNPVLTMPPEITLHSGDTIPLSDFVVSARDPHGAYIYDYQVDNSTLHVALNGVTNTSGESEYRGTYLIKATDMDKATYVAGKPGTDYLYLYARTAEHTSSGELVRITVLPSPVLDAPALSLAAHETVSLASAFKVVPSPGHTLQQFRIETSGRAGEVALNGAANLANAADSAKGVIVVSAADMARLTLTGAPTYRSESLTISAYDGESWGKTTLKLTTLDDSAPDVTALRASVEVNSTVSAAGLFSAASHSGYAIQQYRIVDPNGGGALLLNGARNLADPAEAAQKGVVVIDAADLGKLQYTAASSAGSETLTVAAFDGIGWGSTSFALASIQTRAPVVNTGTHFIASGEEVRITSLFDLDAGNANRPAYYVFHEDWRSIHLNGAVNQWNEVMQPGYYWIKASDIDKVTYVASVSSVRHLEVMINDGYNFSHWSDALIVAGREQLRIAPDVAAGRTTVGLNQSVALADLFIAEDRLGASLLSYRVRDPAGGGRLVLNGAVDQATAADAAAGWTVISAADLGKVRYEGAGASGLETLEIGAYNGIAWGDAPVAITSALRPPVVTPAAPQVERGQTAFLAGFFHAESASERPIEMFKVQDPASGGHFVLNGAVNFATAEQQAQGIAIFSAADLAKVQYAGNAELGRETLLIGAFDGRAWGATNMVVRTTDTRPPQFTVHDTAVDFGAVVPLSKIVSAASPTGETIVQYQVADPSGGGKVLLGSATNLANDEQQSHGIAVVSAYDFAKLVYQPGGVAGSETLQITALDGLHVGTASVDVRSVPTLAPTATARAATAHVGDVLHLADFIAFTDPNGHPLRSIRMYDEDLGIRLNGAVNAGASQYFESRGLYEVGSLDDFRKLDYVARHEGTVHITINVWDGFGNASPLDWTITIVGAPRPA